MQTLTTLIFIFLILISNILAQNITIKGDVKDENNKPIPYVNIYLLNSTHGAMTNDDGSFSFKTNIKGKATLIASMVGYQKLNMELDLLESKSPVILSIILKHKLVEISEAIVMGSAFSSKDGKGVVIKPLEVMTTPGGAADIFQSLKTMPGVTQVSESAELYVRGGDPSETITLLDQASMYHPFTFESSYGGLFSNLNTNAMKGMYFSSGGFSSKYGNVLSGVLDIETKDEPLITSYLIGVSMAATSLSANIPIIDDKLGFRLNAQQSYTKPIMWLNGALDGFTSTPTSRNISLNLTYKYSKTGRLKIFGLFADDKQGVNVKRAEYSGGFDGVSNNNFLNLQISDLLFSNLIIKSSLSYNKHNNYWSLGILNIHKSDRVLKSRTDIEYMLSSKINILSGFEVENRNQKYLGIIPQDDFNIRPDAKGKIVDESLSGNRIGLYSEIEISNPLDMKNAFLISGIRLDYIPELNHYWIDPRIGFGYNLNRKSTIKFAWGIFHQLPNKRLFAVADGNPNLLPMKAIHYVLSYDFKFSKNNSFRIEAYHKDYKNLPLEESILNYSNSGYGFATGIDAILKGQLPFGLDGWISYGLINTKRKWMNFEKLSNSDFDITHNFTVVAKYNITGMWQIGINYKYATGRPFTPIVDATYNKNKNIYVPKYGVKNSERYPNYKRLDFRITHLNQIFGKYFTVFYIEALNILNINNLFGYTYNQNYSEKRVVKSYFGRRTIVMGTQISL